MLGLANMGVTWDLGPHVNWPLLTIKVKIFVLINMVNC